MPIKVECSDCNKTYRVADEAAGKKFRCKSCGTAISVPSADDDVEYAEVDDDVEEYDEPPVRRRQKPQKSKKSKSRSKAGVSPLIWIALAGGGGLLIVCLMVLMFTSGSSSRQPTTTGSPTVQVPLTSIPVPAFPDLGNPRVVLQPSGVRMWFVQMTGVGPGQSMAMRVYLPPTDAPDQSIPCVLVAPAGTNLLVGNDMDADDYHDETLPYAQAGMAVIFYSLDGGVADMENASDAQFAAGYKKFKAAQAGIVNGRNALDFVLAKIPQVNPQQIYSAGHSSAGTVSLLLASHEPRLAGSIAYAPCSDVEARLAPVSNTWGISRLLPDLKSFLHESSPKTHVGKVHCPVFLFHANDDSNVNVSETQAFAQLLKSVGKTVEVQTVPTGEHYNSMIQQGIPRAIAWLKTQTPAP
ncbi:MAG: prolyl oligopeptidase family serine peptidase [Planctomycetes bacterium]|nr:prolyl oligopeptidase family serine peptidase [Planctomycetota bacterium]